MEAEIFAAFCAIEAALVSLPVTISWTGHGSYKHRDD